MIARIPVFVLCLLILVPIQASATTYVQAAGSTLEFSGKYQGEGFKVRFPGFKTQMSFNPADFSKARLDVVIPLGSATTRNPDYDQALLGADFFNSAKFPNARYTASAFKALGAGRYSATGILELRGVKKPVTLNFSWHPGKSPVLTGTAVVKRLDFNIGIGDWADTAMIADDVLISTRVVLNAR